MDFGNTNWNLYRTFVTVFESGNKSKASEKLGITRSAVIQNVKTLERQLGTLFISHKRGVEPTDKAKEIYPQIKDAIAVFVNLERPGALETLKVAVSNSAVEIALIAYMKEWYAKYPSVRVDIVKREGISLVEQKNMNFISDAEHAIERDFKTIEILSATGAFIASKGLIRANKIPLTITRDVLLTYPIISRDVAWQFFLEQNDLSPQIKCISVPSIDATMRMVEDDIGIGFFAKEILRVKPNPNLVVLEVTGAIDTHVRYLCGFVKPLSSVAKAFIDGLIEFCKV